MVFARYAINDYICIYLPGCLAASYPVASMWWRDCWVYNGLYLLEHLFYMSIASHEMTLVCTSEIWHVFPVDSILYARRK